MSRGEYLTVLALVLPAFALGWVGGWLWANRLASRSRPQPRHPDPSTRAPAPPLSGSPDGGRDVALPAEEERREPGGKAPSHS
jgi:hypothetical protein